MSSCQNFSLLFFCKELSVTPWSRACALQISVLESHILTCHCSLSPSCPSRRHHLSSRSLRPPLYLLSVIATSWPHQPTAISPITIVKVHKEFQSSFLPSPADFPTPKYTFSQPACAILPRSKALLAMDLTFRVAGQSPAPQHALGVDGVPEPLGNLRGERRLTERAAMSLPLLPSVGDLSAG